MKYSVSPGKRRSFQMMPRARGSARVRGVRLGRAPQRRRTPVLWLVIALARSGADVRDGGVLRARDLDDHICREELEGEHRLDLDVDLEPRPACGAWRRRLRMLHGAKRGAPSAGAAPNSLTTGSTRKGKLTFSAMRYDMSWNSPSGGTNEMVRSCGPPQQPEQCVETAARWRRSGSAAEGARAV